MPSNIRTRKKIELFLQEEENKIVFRIKDEGVGIKEIDKIFERHYRGGIFQRSKVDLA
jgi:signal transduction histidine kinase